MNKREKHTRIVEHYESHYLQHFHRFTQQHGIRLFSNEAVEEYAAWLVAEHRRDQKINRENRARAAAKAAKQEAA